jgi:Fur family peroxide stress response transcriptional regulator
MSSGKILRKHSGKRDAILEAIRSTGDHPGAQWVYDKLKPRIPGLSLGTVYRNIGLFRKEGVVASVGVVNGEERFDGVTEPHPHLVCGRCGKVADLPCPGPESAFDESLRKLARGTEGFTVDYRRTVFYGLCGECAGQNSK